MGKVYEALSRAEADAEIDNFDDEEEQEDTRLQGPMPERFSFMRYSLGSSYGTKDRPRAQVVTEALVPRQSAKPARELTVDPRRVDPHLTSFHHLDQRASQEFNKLALFLISRAADSGFRRVLIASAQSGDGRTCVTLNLACALARARQRVLVVDSDLENPSVMRMLGLGCEAGMAEAFQKGMSPGDAVVKIQPYGF